MIAREPDAADLIGYLMHDARSSRSTLVVCGPTGRPERRVLLEPLGPVARFLRTLAVRLGLVRNARRAITRDEGDSREFCVWFAYDCSIFVSDAVGGSWMRSAGDRGLRDKRVVSVVPNPEVITIVRRFGYGDASRN